MEAFPKFLILFSILGFILSQGAAERKEIQKEQINLTEPNLPVEALSSDSVAYSRCSSNDVTVESGEMMEVHVLNFSSNQIEVYNTDISCGEGLDLGITSDYIYLEHDNELKYISRAEGEKFKTLFENKEFTRVEDSFLTWEPARYYASPTSQPSKVNLSNIQAHNGDKSQFAHSAVLSFTGSMLYYNEDVRYHPIERSNAECLANSLMTGKTVYFQNKCLAGDGQKILLSGGQLYNGRTGEVSNLENFPKSCNVKEITETGLWGEDNTEEGYEYCYYSFKEEETYTISAYSGDIVAASKSRAITEGATYEGKENPPTQYFLSSIQSKEPVSAPDKEKDSMQEQNSNSEISGTSDSGTSLGTILGAFVLMVLLALGSKKALQAARGGVGSKSKGNKEYKRTCNKCGKTWYVSQKEIQKLEKDKKMNSIAGATLALGGNLTASAVSNSNKDSAEEQLKELEKCPECGSKDYEQKIEELE